MPASREAVEPVFSESYCEARRKFLGAAELAIGAVGGSRVSRPLPPAVKGSEGEELALDFAVLGRGRCDQVYLLTAGQHGVEGYIGSAIQIELLRAVAAGQVVLPKDTLLVIVHVMNPFGMSWCRRWNENNCDLNRNFLPDGLKGSPQTYAARNEIGANSMYRALSPMINPGRRLGFGDCFMLKALKAICCLGRPAIKQAVAGGQPEFPGGLFYSGDRQMTSTCILLEVLAEIGVSQTSPTLRRVVHTDLHSGLGPHGHDSVLTVSGQMKAKVVAALGADRGGVKVGGGCCCRSGYGPGTWHVENMGADGKNQADGKAKGTAYTASGNILDGLKAQLCPHGCDWVSLTQEFGTASNIEVLKALRAENALHQEEPTAPVTTAERQACKEAFYPKSQTWRAQCLARGLEVSLALIGSLVGVQDQPVHTATAKTPLLAA